MSKSQIGLWIFWGAALLVIPLWLISFPETTIKHNLKPFFVYTSQITSLVGFVLFALTFILAARIRWLEDYFNGLDKMYHLHHSMARIAMVMLIVHPVMLALRWIPEDFSKTLWYLFPVHRRLEIDLGSWALWGLIILMVITLINKVPYDKWKLTHKFMGVFFILGISHIYLLDFSFDVNPALMAYLTFFSVAGVIAWIYKSILFDWVTKKYRYRVDTVHRLNDNVIEIELSPENSSINYVPGQFYFFSFRDTGLSRESHPYTVCNITQEGKITIIVKALGDYTRQLHKELKAGTTALLEGPYGRFGYRRGKRDQIWIGGGVGIAPFISWANDLLNKNKTDLKVDLYYCVNTESEAYHLHVFKNLEVQMQGFNVHLVRGDIEGFMNVNMISNIHEKEIFICGPKLMRESILPEIKKNGVLKQYIHYEDFDFS
jgi:predicted ferric reductase